MLPVLSSSIRDIHQDSINMAAAEHGADRAPGEGLWEEMTLRERRQAAHRSGLLLSDWEAQQQLDDALKESKSDANQASIGQQLEEYQQQQRLSQAQISQLRSVHSVGEGEAKGEEDEGSTPSAHGISKGTCDKEERGGDWIGREEDEDEQQEEEEDDEVVPLRRINQEDYLLPALERLEISSSSLGGLEESDGQMRRKSEGKEEEEGEEEKKKKEEEGEEEEEEEEEEERVDILMTLSDDVLSRLVSMLDGDSVIQLGQASKHWSFAREERIFAVLCQRVYLAQTEKKTLSVRRWRSWRNMYSSRPRLRTNGFYILKVEYIKTPVRDMTSTYTPGQILRVVYYRYFRFFSDGRVAYALMHHGPKEAVRLFGSPDSDKIVWGTYTIRKSVVTCEIPASYALIGFTMELTNGARGHFNTLFLERHTTMSHTDPDQASVSLRIKAGEDVFQFKRVWSF